MPYDEENSGSDSAPPVIKPVHIDYKSISKAQKMLLLDEMLRTGLPVLESYLCDLLGVCYRTIRRYAKELTELGRTVTFGGEASNPYLRYEARPPSPAIFDPNYYERWYDRVPVEDTNSRLYNMIADEADYTPCEQDEE